MFYYCYDLKFYHQTVTTQQIEGYLSEKTGIDLTAFFNQYLRTVMIPKLEYSINNNTLKFRYTDIVEDFDMPIQVFINQKEQWIYPNKDWKEVNADTPIKEFKVDEDFYILNQEI